MIKSTNNNEEEKLNDKIEKKLLKAEKQIEEGKTKEASKVFKELKEQFGF